MKEKTQSLKASSHNQRFFYSVFKKMLSYCLRCRKNPESKNTTLVRTKKGRIMLLLKSAVCDRKNIKIYLRERSEWEFRCAAQFLGCSFQMFSFLN